ncbi:GNAT family N-acetyltransferase [Limosilactobacillus fastidiosus]|uniref:GNAT family N-acetyltransferase n=1 Tax=Limosilactobacillus fastidiosus TaxID=2759855 RepID=A0A7W3TYN0_9LACO|nr:GNAT family N-acetyltransferase [Limosilactobacillus fastidiosus]MBB1062587.1 GNAT family N-acetyltransferase [Limosilactobacillus fastidiosus]MBB1085460.1 GNAT family N-acetyltransferase [Limosilactobacillus fastidiosus]MCD7083663.1 GNAT family N-acetyltransferase [Limosilactobacillus fastidiosus]MCD7085913.1 GNAT family N-acetyltransferase [Limosilactobacillus fastidiosus]MCD7114443.1 GNAT family N-acetyltransferase [Limosilactobacillus fastidiosus]
MAQISIRRSVNSDLDRIMEIVDSAKELLKKDGSPQWQDGHPNREMFANDIKNQTNWVLTVGNEIAGTATLQFAPEPAYSEITDGTWNVTDQPYATIHRVAISNNFRGQHLSRYLFSNLISMGQIQGIKNFRIDTYPKNVRMQRLAESFGFAKRGQILVNDKIDPHRIAFELNINN